MYSLLRKALFMTDPETAHGLALESLKLGHNVGATAILSTLLTVVGWPR